MNPISKYIVIELQTYADGSVGSFINTFDDRNTAEQKYHTILAAAAVSQIPTHAAVMLTKEGMLLMNQYYIHSAAEQAEE